MRACLPEKPGGPVRSAGDDPGVPPADIKPRFVASQTLPPAPAQQLSTLASAACG